jgi:hypothetical protein
LPKLRKSYIERKCKIGVKAGEQDKQGCDEVVNSCSAGVGRHRQGDDAHDGGEGSTHVLRKLIFLIFPPTKHPILYTKTRHGFWTMSHYKIRESVTFRAYRAEYHCPSVLEGEFGCHTVHSVLVHTIGHCNPRVNISRHFFLARKQNLLFKMATEPMVTPKNASGHDEVSIMASTTVRMKTITSTTKLQTTLDVRLLLK